MASNLAKIQHIVVVMLENRSFDNMLGFLYADQGNVPPRNLPAQDPASFDGLLPPAISDAFWNPANADFFSTPGTAPDKVFASSGTTGPHRSRFPILTRMNCFLISTSRSSARRRPRKISNRPCSASWSIT